MRRIRTSVGYRTRVGLGYPSASPLYLDYYQPSIRSCAWERHLSQNLELLVTHLQPHVSSLIGESSIYVLVSIFKISDMVEQGMPGYNDDLHSLLVNTAIETTISPDDLDEALTRKPFASVAGTFNLRDIGHIPQVRPKLIYRSGTLSGLVPKGKDVLVNDLGVGTVFDLRSERERQMSPFPDSLNESDDIEVLWCPSDVTPAEMEIQNFAELVSEGPTSWDGGARGFTRDYLEVLRIFKTAFQKVFRHLLDRPGDAILFNCTAGKDRTGTLAALILSLTGVPDDRIAFDYALSRIGMEPQKAYLTALIKKWKPDWTPETPGMRGFSNVRAEYMVQFLQDAKSTYATVDGSRSEWAAEYLHTHLGFDRDEIGKIRENLSA